MAAKKIRKHVLNAEGVYEIEHTETSADIVLTDDNSTVQDKIDEHDLHAIDEEIHITSAERDAWNNKDDSGSADAAEANAKEYTETLIAWGFF